MSKATKALNIASTSEDVIVSDPAMKNMLAYVDKGKYDEAIKWIQNKKVENEQVVTISDKFDAYPADGAHAFTEVLKKTYGWVEQLPQPVHRYASSRCGERSSSFVRMSTWLTIR